MIIGAQHSIDAVASAIQWHLLRPWRLLLLLPLRSCSHNRGMDLTRDLGGGL
jgi:hypothetical protein